MQELSLARIGQCVAVITLGCIALPASGAEHCDERVRPPDDQAAPVDVKKPTHFSPVTGGTNAPALDFIGDSLTVGNEARFARRTAQLVHDRSYEVFALGGQDSLTLAELFDTVPVDAAMSG